LNLRDREKDSLRKKKDNVNKGREKKQILPAREDIGGREEARKSSTGKKETHIFTKRKKKITKGHGLGLGSLKGGDGPYLHLFYLHQEKKGNSREKGKGDGILCATGSGQKGRSPGHLLRWFPGRNKGRHSLNLF